MRLVLLLLACARANGQAVGALECPCLEHTSPAFAGLPATATAKGLPQNYGQEGCKTYDEGVSAMSCENNAGIFCKKSWCFVDMDLCPENKTLCEENGGTLGSRGHPSCRSRDSAKTSALAGTAYSYLSYSYATCGDLDFFTQRMQQISGRALQAAMQASKMSPWHYPSDPFQVDVERPHLLGYRGVLLDSVDDLLRIPTRLSPPQPTVALNLSTVWASKESRTKFPLSSYTACCYDVLLGKTDVCIGDVWVTAERVSLGVQFISPPFDSDNMYLIAPRKVTAEDFGTVLGKPFLPFKPDLWAAILVYIFLSALVTFVTDLHNEEDFENQTSYLVRLIKSVYLNSLGYLTGGPANNACSVPGRVATLGFGFFCMITLTTYTANLATLLVTSTKSNAIGSIEQAIDARLKICVQSAIRTEIGSLYPTADFIESSDEHEMLALSHEGPGQKCNAFITSAKFWQRMSAGEFAVVDCELEAEGGPGPKVKDHFLCKKGKEVDLRRDCDKFTMVGMILTSVPLSMPISPNFKDAFSARLREAKETGLYDAALARAKDESQPVSACPAGQEERDESGAEGAGVDSMLGTLVISVACQLVALILSGIEHRAGVHVCFVRWL